MPKFLLRGAYTSDGIPSIYIYGGSYGSKAESC
jgi:hypothetical protein